jgi:hypothetical protein
MSNNKESDFKMIYQVFQIQLSDLDIAKLNNGASNDEVPAFAAKMAMQIDFRCETIGTIASNAFNSGLYTHVADITAPDLNGVFEIGNIGPESSIERVARMSSLSVGDVIVDESGTMTVVASNGFVKLLEDA